MTIPFTKAHGARNDFLLTRISDVPAGDRPAMARAICDRHTGVGADGWLLIAPPDAAGHDAAIHLFNSDGSEAEISGNGTRCAAAFLVQHGHSSTQVRIRTGAGVKSLRLLERSVRRYQFEMNMGQPEFTAVSFPLPLEDDSIDVSLIWVGNPQCAVPVDNFDFDWRIMGATIERHPQFPKRTNVSFLHRRDDHTLEVRFWERGAGETMSSAAAGFNHPPKF